MKSVIVGKGEIGSALGRVLADYGPIFLDFHIDLRIIAGEYAVQNPEIDILHVCFGYSDQFVASVKHYQDIFRPKYTIIHSTVPVGTSKQCKAIHSPVIGQHPFLEDGIRTFPKMLGGKDASLVADYFRRAGLKVVLFDEPETTEAAKLFLTEYYKVCIEFTQRVKAHCEENNLSFHEVYTLPNQIYNQGYKMLGYEEFVRPILQPIMTPIGGHCVQQNSKLIK